MMPESYFNSWALFIIINHDDDALFNIHGTLQQFLLAVSLNGWISSRRVTYYSVQVKKQEAQRETWLLDHTLYHWQRGYESSQSSIFVLWHWRCSYTFSFLKINFHIKSFSYTWEAKKVPLNNSIRHIIGSQ